MNYCLGFMVDSTAGYVALIKKVKPEFLANKWNGIGGKLEPGETAALAMRREFLEETGVDHAYWLYCGYSGFSWTWMDVFLAQTDAVFDVETVEAEEVAVYSVRAVLDGKVGTADNVARLLRKCLPRLYNGRCEPFAEYNHEMP